MTLLSLILALALEQVYPLGYRNRVWLLFSDGVNSLERVLDGGLARHGALAWALGVGPLVGIALLCHYLIYTASPGLASLWNVIVLYFTMGFRHFSSAFSDISLALTEGRKRDAQAILSKWTGKSTAALSINEISRVAIEQGVIDSYRCVFGTMFWFILLPGPSGALLFRLSTILSQRWGHSFVGANHFGDFAVRMTAWLDWAPARLTAASFAVMGNLEDAIYCWRSYVKTWGPSAIGILLASAAGALGVRLGRAMAQDDTIRFRQEFGIVGDEASPDALRSAVGLVWRSVLLWLSIILLVSVVNHLS